MAKQKQLADGEWADKVPEEVEEAAEVYDKIHAKAQKIKGELNVAKANVIAAMEETGCKKCPVRGGEKFLVLNESSAVKFEKPKWHPAEDMNGDGHEGNGEIVTQKRIKGGRHVTKRTPAKVSAVPNDEGAGMPLSALVDHGMTVKKMEAVASSVGPTVGHLEKAMRENEYWHRDIKGLGKEWIDKLVDALLSFRREHPVPSEAPTILEAAGAGT